MSPVVFVVVEVFVVVKVFELELSRAYISWEKVDAELLAVLSVELDDT